MPSLPKILVFHHKKETRERWHEQLALNKVRENAWIIYAESIEEAERHLSDNLDICMVVVSTNEYGSLWKIRNFIITVSAAKNSLGGPIPIIGVSNVPEIQKRLGVAGCLYQWSEDDFADELREILRLI